MKFRIIENIYRNEYGEQKSKNYHIEVQKKFLGIRYWKAEKHLECGYGDCYNVITKFETHTAAYEFAVTKIARRVKKDGWDATVINQFEIV
jgi:uncharacterized protein (DUF1800 family)